MALGFEIKEKGIANSIETMWSSVEMFKWLG